MRIKTMAAVAAALAILIFASVIVADVKGIGGSDTQIDLKIAKGAGTAEVASSLKSSGIISSKTAFRLYSKCTGDHLYQMGMHKLSSSMSYSEIIAELEKIPVSESGMVTIPEGFELRQVADRLEKLGLINREVFMREIEAGNFNYDFVAKIPERENRLEGYLYPGTYSFTGNQTEHEIIDMMLANFERVVIPVYNQSGTDRSLDEIINLASIVEREAASDDERGKVASVFLNRINIGMKLESCATVQYILKERKSVLSNEDTQISSPYNTYVNHGLPIGPIASPGIKSIEAALNPEQTNYLYFIAAADGSHSIFSETYEEHRSMQEQIQGAQ